MAMPMGRSEAGAGVRVAVGMEWTRETPTAWQEALDRAFPPSEHLSHFRIVWEPGDAWQPIERYMIWQMRPAWALAKRPDILKALHGPHPRSTGHYCAPGWCLCPMKTNNWRGGPKVEGAAALDRLTYELYHATGYYGVRWWTLQGNLGGHRHRLDTVEKQIAKLKAGVSETPAPGDLPYAEFDARTFWKIVETDRVNHWKGAAQFHLRGSAAMSADEADLAAQAGDLVWGWLESQVDRTHEAVGRAGWRALAEAAPRVPWAAEPRMDRDDVRESVTAETVDALAGAA